MSGTVTITGLSASEPAGQRILGPLSVQGYIVVGDTQATALAMGDNVIPVPAGAIGAVVIPPATGTATLTYRTNLNQADVGLSISPAQPFVHVFPSPGPTTIILNASAAQSAFTSIWVW
jgi:hypothetical protein